LLQKHDFCKHLLFGVNIDVYEVFSQHLVILSSQTVPGAELSCDPYIFENYHTYLELSLIDECQ
jgi:hypothetical protein